MEERLDSNPAWSMARFAGVLGVCVVFIALSIGYSIQQLSGLLDPLSFSREESVAAAEAPAAATVEPDAPAEIAEPGPEPAPEAEPPGSIVTLEPPSAPLETLADSQGNPLPELEPLQQTFEVPPADPLAMPADPGFANQTGASGELWRSTVDGLNVRAGPGNSFPVVTVLFMASAVEVPEITNDGWMRVTVDGVTGYVYGRYMERASP